MEYLFLNNEIILDKIKEEIKYNNLVESCEKLRCDIDYSKVYFFVNIDPDQLGFIYTMALLRKKIDRSICTQIYAGVKINRMKSLFHLLDLLTNNQNDNINFVVFNTFIGFHVRDTFFFNPGDIKKKISKEVEIHENDRIYSSYSNQFYYDLLLFTIDSYQNGQLFRKTYQLLYENGDLYLMKSYPSFFQYSWNFLKNMLTQKEVKNDKKGNPHIKLHDE